MGRQCCGRQRRSAAIKKFPQHRLFPRGPQSVGHAPQSFCLWASGSSGGNKCGKASEDHDGLCRSKCGGGEKVQSKGMADHQSLFGLAGPDRQQTRLAAIASFCGLPLPALSLKSPLPGSPDRCVSSPAVCCDHLPHRLGSICSKRSSVSSGRSRLSTNRSRAVPSGTVGGRMATASKPPCSSSAWASSAARSVPITTGKT